MIASVVHTMVTADDEEGVGKTMLVFDSAVNGPDHVIHLPLFRNHIGAVEPSATTSSRMGQTVPLGTCLVPDVIQTQIM